MKAGKYLARIVGYGVGKPKEAGQRPSIFVQFRLTETEEEIYWWGNMTDGKADAKKKPYEITIDSLLTMGLKGSDPYAVADGLDSDVLNADRDYQLVLEDHEWNGKKSIRVKFINLPGKGVTDVLSSQEARAMAGYNFAADVMARRQELGVKDEPRAKANTNTNTNLEDISF